VAISPSISERKETLNMEPAKRDQPSIGLFLLMTAAYFGAYFGLKYGVLNGEMPWYYNAALIGTCLLLALVLKNRFAS